MTKPQPLRRLTGWLLADALLKRPGITAATGAPHLARLRGMDLALALGAYWVTAGIGAAYLHDLKCGSYLRWALNSHWVTAEIGAPHLGRLTGFDLAKSLASPWVTLEIALPHLGRLDDSESLMLLSADWVTKVVILRNLTPATFRNLAHDLRKHLMDQTQGSTTG